MLLHKSLILSGNFGKEMKFVLHKDRIMSVRARDHTFGYGEDDLETVLSGGVGTVISF